MKQVNVKTEKKLLDSNLIKIIAILAMTVDHIAWAVFPGYPQKWLPILMHLVGRITCPIMCYFIAEGYHYTRNIRKYMLRLFAFALLSHFCYLYASTDFAGLKSFLPFASGKILNQTSVMWSLAWGLVMLQVANSARIKNSVLRIILILLICLVSFPSDWSCIAALCILSFGTNRGNFKAQSFWLIFYVGIYAIVYFFAIDKLYGILQMGVVLSLPILRLYNGQRGKNQSLNRFMKWFFYLYYPLHLLIIGLILHPLFPAQRDGIEVSGVSAIEETSIPEDATKMAYIIDMTETSVTIDEIEWITLDMTDRIAELGIQDDMPNGFYIYNPSKETQTIPINASCKCILFSYEENYFDKEFDIAALMRLYKKKSDHFWYPFIFTIKNGEVIEMMQQYVP